MSRKRLRDFAGSVILIVLSMIVFAGTTGLSYKAHYCNGNLSGIAFYTELGLQKPASCGCKCDLPVTKHPLSESKPALQKKSCCSNISFFSRLSLEYPVTFSFPVTLLQPAMVIADINNAVQPVCEKDNIHVFDFRFRPPPKAGRELVLFLSQQRIPYSIYS